MICVACGNSHHEKFCPECGQSSSVKPISFSFIIQELFSVVTNMNKGYLYNIKQLVVNTQDFVVGYLKGNRRFLLNPLSFLIVSITIYLIGESIMVTPQEASEDHFNTTAYIKGKQVGRAARIFIEKYFKYFWVLSIWWLGLSTKIVFGRYNYAEHVTIASFVIGLATVIGLLGLSILQVPILFNGLMYVVLMVLLFQIFKSDKQLGLTFFKTILAIILFFSQLIILILVIGSIALGNNTI